MRARQLPTRICLQLIHKSRQACDYSTVFWFLQLSNKTFTLHKPTGPHHRSSFLNSIHQATPPFPRFHLTVFRPLTLFRITPKPILITNHDRPNNLLWPLRRRLSLCCSSQMLLRQAVSTELHMRQSCDREHRVGSSLLMP